VANALAARVIALGAHGINIDFEALAPEDAAGLVAFTAALRAALHPSGRTVTIDVAANDRAFDLARLGAVADGVLLLAYDEHHPSSAPGPVATTQWISDAVDAARVVPAERLVVALGSYCYDWPARGEAESLSYAAAMARAARVGAAPVVSPDGGGARFAWSAPDGAAHTVWCNDATSIADALAMLRERGVARTALWRAGTEDPSLWAVLRAPDANARARALATVAAPVTPEVTGEGDLIAQRAPGRVGRREVALDARGRVTAGRYLSVPTAPLVERLGGDASKRDVALTFDDGPDPVHTAALLDVLRDLNAPAGFFVVGDQAMQHPELVRRAAREGHLIGNHSYHHPRMNALSAADYADELDRTTRLLEGLAGREVSLYRAPFTALVDASDRAELAAQAGALSRGYTYAAASVDPHDWQGGDAETLARRVIEGVVAGGRVVVMHDGGGDRRATVEAVRRVVPRLRAMGYRLVSLDTYARVTRDAMAPRLGARDRVASLAVGWLATTRSHATRALALLFTACTLLASLRIVMLAALALRARRPTVENPDYKPLVTVLVPAYNEATVIEGSVRSLLRGEYTNLEVLVVDDGSRDDTAAIVERIAATQPRVRCVRKPNGGKASAANVGIREARGEIIVAVDADTVIAPDAIRRMVAHFADPAVTAVCGNVEVGNVRSWLTAFQAIEYVTSQNFDRRAFAALNCIGVVPGALGAWRRADVLAVGGYSHDTLVEDADLTVTVLRAGGVITYEPRAIGRTEAPESLGALWRQRIRWTYGTYQCLAKHRSALLRGSLGWVALPNLLLFQVLFPVASPLGDLAMGHAIVTGQWSAFLSGYLGFLSMDIIASVLAFRMDRKPLHWLALLLVQRFTYRQFLYAVSLWSMVSAALGGRQGWSKLDRLGTVAPLPPRPSSMLPAPMPAMVTEA
jgi:cellulose synthase/poly-beta-1,6-N-acetylglucosamine synthase-like glycosyltransferase/peptidoglycan/xylan/chitin deacetylase (PgdA/CDA1 family)